MGAFLMGLRVRGESIDEIVGAVAAMRANAWLRVDRTGRRRSTSSGRAATGTAPTTFRRWRRSSSPHAACRSPSTATAPPRRALARATCSAALGVAVGPRRRRRSEDCLRGSRHCLHVGAGPPRGHAPFRGAYAPISAPARSSTCSARSSNPAGVERLLARRLSRRTGWSRSRASSGRSAPHAPGWCTGRTGSTRLTTTGTDATWSPGRTARSAELRRSRPGGGRLAARRRVADADAAVIPPSTRRRCGPCSTGPQGALPGRRRLSTRRPALCDRRTRAGDLREGRSRPRLRRRSTTGAARAHRSTGSCALSQRQGPIGRPADPETDTNGRHPEDDRSLQAAARSRRRRRLSSGGAG